MTPGTWRTVALLVLVLFHTASLRGVLGDELGYYEEYGQPWNDTEAMHDYGGYTAPNPAFRSLQHHPYGYAEEVEPRVWSRDMQEGDYYSGADTARRVASALGSVSRRFAAPTGGAGRADGGSCPGGACPNPELYEEHDLHYDPRYPYDSCHYLGGLDSFRLNGTETCHLEVRGADGHADRLSGGLDGTYLLVGCFEGKPIYLRSRADGPPGEDRVLYYNSHFGAWEFAVGAEPIADQLVLAGDEGAVSPLDVARWHLAAAFNSEQAALLPAEDEELYYVATGVSVMCAGPSDESLVLRGGEEAAAAAAPVDEEGGAEGRGRGKEAEAEEKGRKGRSGQGRGGAARGKGRGGSGGRGGSERGEEEDGREGTEEENLSGQGPAGESELDREVRELREYWRRHEEEYYEMRYPYGEYAPDGAYDDGAQGPGYDDGYGLY